MMKAKLFFLLMLCPKIDYTEDIVLSTIPCERVNDDPMTWRTTCKIPAEVYYQVFQSDFFRCTLGEEVYVICADPSTRLGYRIRNLTEVVE